jgi:probable HAF family extracellular repeat protein
MTDLGTLPGDTMSIAQAINNQGQVVGESSATNGPDHAFLWTRAGGMVALGTLPGDSSSRAADINDQGQVVGTSTRSDGQPHAFMWTQAGGMAGLSPLPGHQVSSANGINDRGQVVGSSGDRVGEYVVLWGADTTAPTATFKVTRGQRLSTTAVRFRLTLSEPGTAAVKLSWAGHAIARKTVTFAAAGSRSVTLKLTAAQRRKLRRHTKATLSLLAVATDPDHNASTARTRFVLR